ERDPDGVVGHPPERSFTGDGRRGRDAVVDDATMGGMTDPSTEHRVVQRREAEAAPEHEAPGIHQGRAADADQGAGDEDRTDIGHVDVPVVTERAGAALVARSPVPAGDRCRDQREMPSQARPSPIGTAATRGESRAAVTGAETMIPK